MLYTLALLLAAVAAAASAAGGSAPICCMPDQFRVTNFYANTNVKKTKNSFHTVKSISAYDYINHREVYYTTRTSPQEVEQYDYYLDYPTNLMYTISNKTGICYKAYMNKNHGRRCVPGFGNVTDPSFTYGGASQNITALRAIFTSPRLDGNHLYTSMTVGPNCIPVVVKLTLFPFGAGGLETETIEYNDVIIGPIPEFYFQLPTACCQAKFGEPTYYPGLHFNFNLSTTPQ